jgi:thiamine-monophosphate kinase
LADEKLATAAIDISDGWGGDLFHICEASRVRARVRLADFPRANLVEAGAALHVDPSDWQLGPSDDYELLFTAPPVGRDRILELGSAGIDATVVGIIEEGAAALVIEDAVAPRGWDHFADGGEP